jgi:hypothetical protein
MLTRRKLIDQCLKMSVGSVVLPGMGGLLFGARPGLAAAADSHFFVFVQVYGAWDVCLAFDPKDRDQRLSNGEIAFDQPYGINEVQTYGRIPLAPHGAALGPFADRLSLVNGIDMELDNGHTPVIVMTGAAQGSGQKPSIQAMVSDRHPYVRKCLIPHMYGAYDGFFAGGSLSGKTVTISPMDAHQVLFNAGGTEHLRKADVATRAVAAGADAASRQKLGKYAQALSQAALVREALASRGGGVTKPPTGPEEFGDFTGILFQSGLMGSITWSLGSTYSFDTHSDHYALHPLNAALTDIAKFCERLKLIGLDDNTSVFDRTTVVLAAEYARAPRLNSGKGKEHNFRTNTLGFLGYGVRPGVFGASGERKLSGGGLEAHAGLPVDFATGMPKEDGEVLKARNVWAGSGSIFDFDLTGDFGMDTRPVAFLGV